MLVAVEEEERQQRRYQENLLKLNDFNEAFELVKLAVNTKFKIDRAGLSLILQGLPTNLGAYHILGSNIIVINRLILSAIKRYKSVNDYNSYLFVVLAHEYLHSFGITEELLVRQMTYELCRSLLGKKHPASIIAKEDASTLDFTWTNWNLLRQYNIDTNFEIVKNFDKTTQSYIQ